MVRSASLHNIGLCIALPDLIVFEASTEPLPLDVNRKGLGPKLRSIYNISVAYCCKAQSERSILPVVYPCRLFTIAVLLDWSVSDINPLWKDGDHRATHTKELQLKSRVLG